MVFDLFTTSMLAAVVVVVSGVLFIVESVVRKDAGAGRVWSLAFLGAILSTLCYLAWAAGIDPWIAVAVGNAAFVAGTGSMWLGCRSFNGRILRVPAIIVSAASVAALVAVLIEGPDGGDWAGAVVMFVALATFAILGSIESRRGAMGRHATAIGLTVVLAFQGLFYTARTLVFLAAGPESAIFQTWFGSITVSFLTVILTIVAVVTISVLRGTPATRTMGDAATLALSPDGVLLPGSFERVLGPVLDRARQSGERIAVIALRIDDLPHIATAFGPLEAEDITREWRAGVRRYAPTTAMIGETDTAGLVVGFPPSSIGDARRIASRIHRRVLDDFATMGTAVVPVVGVGIALTDSIGYDADQMVRAASEAATRSASSPDASVIIAGMV
ncbi:MAG: hypothetical protein DI573_10835 [Microbacterium sp.]|uniref:hypothetical protein n=1 Tax=unclassified Microbacterium TaxID=2609290 RepID=UPI000DB8BF54|nr:hypothetical protein [Microbacterium sp.]PZU37856.1 MAG: hypothetical protein DI573_10835 [Microbacterium sp.]